MIEHKKCHIRIKVLPGHLNLARDMPSDEDYKTLLNFDAAKLVIFDRIAKNPGIILKIGDALLFSVFSSQ